MKWTKRICSLALSFVMLVSMLPVTAFSEENVYQPGEIASDYFYDQLNERAKAIYDKLLDEFTGPDKKNYQSGTGFIDLMNLTPKNGQTPVISESDVSSYINGNKDIFNDFTAAKDALDLDHSELWWLDSGYLTFRVTQDDQKGYHVLIGPGRGDTYLLAGEKLEDLESKIQETDKAVEDIVSSALSQLKEAEEKAGAPYSDQDRQAALITSVHDQIVKKIHYRYETECRENGLNAKYIRTLYGIVTHEGVCEAYARTLQVCLTKLGIECVLVHGVQTKGTPEDHMWNAVNIPDGGEDHWYVVDATWDDPLTANWDGTRDLNFNNGLDGKETNTYLLAGQSLVGEYWRPSGFVSTGNFEFQYPTIEEGGYPGAVVFGETNGLEVKYSAGGSQEDETPAGVYTATFKGWNVEQAAKNGFFFIIKMYDYHPDGTAHIMDEWYYANATILVSGGNPYFGDYPNGLHFSSATCEYVEIAVTSREPNHFKQWDPKNPGTFDWKDGYFQGDESEIVAQSGMLYNVNSSYEAPPYVASQVPAPNGNSTAGCDLRFKVTYDDDLYHILPNDEGGVQSISAASDNFKDDYPQARTQDVQVRYSTNQQDLHNNGAVVTTQVSGELPFDRDRDGIVDMDGDYTDFKWIYKSDQGVKCPNTAYHKTEGIPCSVENGCPIVGVEFQFRASDQWIDDVTEYNFSIEGVVGSRSRKYPNNFSTISVIPGLCPACYRSQGIDWNLWGQPTLLDAPENLNLRQMAEEGGTDAATLEALDKEINKSGLNGRLMLVVEDKSKGVGNREEYEKINGYLEADGKVKGDVIASSVFEINFNRICPMVNLKPNKGESLRVQVGYPAGVTYESLGKGEVELKAYHFTRCDPANEETHPCPNKDNEGHKWGSDIVGVDEITIVPTPYGMVIMCDAFSPFEIVAVKRDSSQPVQSKNTVVVVSDGNGTVEDSNGTEAVGKNGNVTFDAGESKTFTVKPKDGYEVDTVSLGGQKIDVTDNKFTIADVKNSDVLSVTFLPTSVKEAEENVGDTVVANVCTHSKVEPVEDGHKATEATCTEEGYVLGTVCSTCGQKMSEGHVVPAKGHTIDETSADNYKKGTPAKCEEAGTRNYVRCTTCQTVLSNSEQIPALGHLFTNYEKGEKNCLGTKKTATCDREGCGVVGTIIDPTEKGEHQFVDGVCTVCGFSDCSVNPHVLVKTEGIPSTCTVHGEKTYYTCKFCHKHFEDENGSVEVVDLENWKVLDLLPHSWAEGYSEKYADAEKHYHVCTVCSIRDEGAAHRWNADEPTENADVHCEDCGYVKAPMLNHQHKGIMIASKAATCTEAGNKEYYTCTCGIWFEDEDCTVEIKDHDTVVIPAAHTGIIKVDAKPATETENGNIEYWYCSVCDKYFKDEGLTIEIRKEETIIEETGTQPTPVVYYGDVNRDDQVDTEDALAILRHVVRLVEIKDETMYALADLNGDKDITVDDALEVLKIVVRLIDKKPFVM